MNFIKLLIFAIVMLLGTAAIAQTKTPFATTPSPVYNRYAYTNNGLWFDSSLIAVKYRGDSTIIMFDGTGKAFSMPKNHFLTAAALGNFLSWSDTATTIATKADLAGIPVVDTTSLSNRIDEKKNIADSLLPTGYATRNHNIPYTYTPVLLNAAYAFNMDGVKYTQLGQYGYFLGGWTPSSLYNKVYKFNVNNPSVVYEIDTFPAAGRHTFIAYTDTIGVDTLVIALGDDDNIQPNAYGAVANDTGKLTWFLLNNNVSGGTFINYFYAYDSKRGICYYGGGQVSNTSSEGGSDTVWKTTDNFRTSTVVSTGNTWLIGTASDCGVYADDEEQIHIINGGVFDTNPLLRNYSKRHKVSYDYGVTWVDLPDVPWNGRLWPALLYDRGRIVHYGGTDSLTGNRDDLHYYDVAKQYWHNVVPSTYPTTLPATHAAAFGVMVDSNGAASYVRGAGNFNSQMWQVTLSADGLVNRYDSLRSPIITMDTAKIKWRKFSSTNLLSRTLINTTRYFEDTLISSSFQRRWYSSGVNYVTTGYQQGSEGWTTLINAYMGGTSNYTGSNTSSDAFTACHQTYTGWHWYGSISGVVSGTNYRSGDSTLRISFTNNGQIRQSAVLTSTTASALNDYAYSLTVTRKQGGTAGTTGLYGNFISTTTGSGEANFMRWDRNGTGYLRINEYGGIVSGSQAASGAAFMGISGGDYANFGYNMQATGTGSTYTKVLNDVSSRAYFVNGGVDFGTSAAAAGGTNITFTSIGRFTSTGNLLLGTTTDVANSILTMSSTTKGFLPPRMTTTQKAAISTPASGLSVFDNTLLKPSFYNGSAWESVAGITAAGVLQATGTINLNSAPTNTSNVYKTLVRNTSDGAVESIDLKAVIKAHTDSLTGWAAYVDTTTSAAPQVIATGVTDTLENNADSTITSQLPLGVTAFYNPATKKILGNLNGDEYSLSIRFKATCSVNNGYFSIGMSINGSTYIAQSTEIFTKNSGVEQTFNIPFDYYTLATFIANGGTIKVTADNGDLSIYSCTYLITRKHKAR